MHVLASCCPDVVLMSLLLLIRTFARQGLSQKIENELRCHLSCLL